VSLPKLRFETSESMPCAAELREYRRLTDSVLMRLIRYSAKRCRAVRIPACTYPACRVYAAFQAFRRFEHNSMYETGLGRSPYPLNETSR